MSKFGVAPAEDLHSVLGGEIRRINLGTRVVVEITDEAAEAFPGIVYDTEDQATAAAKDEAVQ